MISATRLVASGLGLCAGLLALEHGIFEIHQGGDVAGGVMINTVSGTRSLVL